MRLHPIRPINPARRSRDAAFTADSRLRGMVLRMIALNSLAAFAQEIGRRPPVEPVRAAAASIPAAGLAAADPAAAPQRPLEAVPPQPARPLPRGSLLDLRV
jgi:hypothetical protein